MKWILLIVNTNTQLHVNELTAYYSVKTKRQQEGARCYVYLLCVCRDYGAAFGIYN